MASGGSVTYTLQLSRSAQSGPKSLTVGPNYQVVYTDNFTTAYLFGGAWVDLTQMALGDTISVRVRKILTDGGAWIVHKIATYTGAQPADHLAFEIGALPDLYGIEIAVDQTAGTARTLNTEFYVAK